MKTARELADALLKSPRLSFAHKLALRRELQQLGIVSRQPRADDAWSSKGFAPRPWVATWNPGDAATLFRAKNPPRRGAFTWHVREFCAPEDSTGVRVIPDFDNYTATYPTGAPAGRLCMRCGAVRNLTPGVNVPKRETIEKDSDS